MSMTARPRTKLRFTHTQSGQPSIVHAGVGHTLRVLGAIGLLASAACGSDKAPASRPPGGNAGMTGSTGSGGASSGGGGASGGGGTASGRGGAAGSSGGIDASGPRPEVSLPDVMEQGMATAKFCNPLVDGNMQDVEFTLELGTKKVTFKANTGVCTPLKGMPCTSIPAGVIPIRLSARGMVLLEGVSNPITAGAELLFVTDVDEMTGELDLGGGVLKPTFQCSAIDLDTLFPPGDGGAGGPDAAPRPPRTPKIVTDWSQFAPIESLGLKRVAGQSLRGKWQELRP